MTSKKVVKWLKTHPLISISALETKLELPRSTLLQATMAGGRDIPEKHIPAITKELRKYGLK